MKRRRWLLIAAGGIFALWTSWLAYEAATTTTVIIVSRPQILFAPIVVEAEIRELKGAQAEAIIRQVYRGGGKEIQPGKALVVDLHSARGWQKPGVYILALDRENNAQASLFVVPIPISPGFRPPQDSELAAPPIYPATESTRYQVRAILGIGEPAK
jgi:hypothetical protein